MGTSKRDIYKLLEAKMLTYADYTDIRVESDDDSESVPFEALRSQGVYLVQPINDSMADYTGTDIIVRQPLVDLLYLAGQELKALDRTLTLRVAYGYRTLDVQTRLFEEAKAALIREYPDEESLIMATHRRVAVPVVAGHPTGGAVDVDIFRDGSPVDMATDVWEHSRDSFTFSPFISRDAWQNRQLLRRAMMGVGFAPFDGEWWHFSYGDKEWARYYRKEAALFDQVLFGDVRRVDGADALRRNFNVT